jgi:hypothetical protein
MLPKDHDGVVGDEDLVEDNGIQAEGKEAEDAAERVTWELAVPMVRRLAGGGGSLERTRL